uniref:Uncharacterized protein n=1 Tax=Nelumbo nucifera TaxID=4432 RepID=A0A822XVR0_NELNU|nr:TPA_asm: hypothetical protein HUJ06_025894 [Nelumbo nucifera]
MVHAISIHDGSVALNALGEEDKYPVIEEKESSNSKVAVKLTNGLRRDRAAKASFLNETLRLSEATSVASRAVVDANNMNHVVTIEEMVIGDELE